MKWTRRYGGGEGKTWRGNAKIGLTQQQDEWKTRGDRRRYEGDESRNRAGTEAVGDCSSILHKDD